MIDALAAELVYHKLVCSGEPFGPGSQVEMTWTPNPKHQNAAAWTIDVEVTASAVWRRGRLFLRCRACQRRATRLYVPLVGLEPRCRRCWGLSYESQSWSYKATGPFGAYLGPVAHWTTHDRRKARRQAARDRYAARRKFMDGAADSDVRTG